MTKAKNKIFKSNGLIYHDFYFNKIEIEKDMSEEELSEFFIENFLGYFECSKCGRSDYCKFVERNEYNNKIREIKCGVIKNIIENIINFSFPIICKLQDVKERQNFIDAMISIIDYLWNTEQLIGILMNKDYLKWYKPYSPFFIGSLTKHSKNLLEISSKLANIKEFHTIRFKLYVEGDSDKVFFKELKRTNLIYFKDIDVVTYKGKGNVKNLKLHLNQLKKDGIYVFLAGDSDRGKNYFEKLIKNETIKNDCCFAFKNDFESSFPLIMIYKAITRLYGKEIIQYDMLLEISKKEGGLIKNISRYTSQFGYNLENDKKELAKILAKFMINIFELEFTFIFNENVKNVTNTRNKDFLIELKNSEIIKLLKMLMAKNW